jgi:hypothetical protein
MAAPWRNPGQHPTPAVFSTGDCRGGTKERVQRPSNSWRGRACILAQFHPTCTMSAKQYGHPQPWCQPNEPRQIAPKILGSPASFVLRWRLALPGRVATHGTGCKNSLLQPASTKPAGKPFLRQIPPQLPGSGPVREQILRCAQNAMATLRLLSGLIRSKVVKYAPMPNHPPNHPRRVMPAHPVPRYTLSMQQ